MQMESQWFAEQGFAVLVIDGRGTPGRGSELGPGVYRNLADPVLEDQVDERHGAAGANIPSSIWDGLRSAAGPSVVSSQPWPSFVAPTCSTRR